jgi:hypothetical protein
MIEETPNFIPDAHVVLRTLGGLGPGDTIDEFYDDKEINAVIELLGKTWRRGYVRAMITMMARERNPNEPSETNVQAQ